MAVSNHPPELLSRGHGVAAPLQGDALHPGVGQEEEGAKCRQQLEGGGMTVSLVQEDEDLQEPLKVSVVETLGYPDLHGEGHPLLLVIEASEDTDHQQLDREASQGEQGYW